MVTCFFYNCFRDLAYFFGDLKKIKYANYNIKYSNLLKTVISTMTHLRTTILMNSNSHLNPTLSAISHDVIYMITGHDRKSSDN